LGAEEQAATQRLTLYLPNKDKNGGALTDPARWLKEARELLSRIGGGATALPPARGPWGNDGGGVGLGENPVCYMFFHPRTVCRQNARTSGVLAPFWPRDKSRGSRGGVRRPILSHQAFRPTGRRVSMAKKLNLIGQQAERIRDIGPIQPRIAPEEFATALG